jgi:hypothetical protein
MAAVLLQAHDIGRAEAAIFAVPELGRVLGPVFLGDSPLPQEGIIPVLIRTHAAVRSLLFQIYRIPRKEERKEERETLSTRHVPYVPARYEGYVPARYEGYLPGTWSGGTGGMCS